MEALISKEQKDYFWKKKELVSFFLSILVFMIHISSFAHYAGADGTIRAFNEKLTFFFKESITRFAVPMYFILSGIAFFRDYDNKKYVAKLKSRFFTLCIPYLIWNTLCMLFDIACSYTFVAKFLSGRKQFVLSLTNILDGIFLHGCNIPFWYIKYLIVFVLCAPLFYLLVRNRYVGILSTVLLSALAVFRIGVDYGLHYEAIVFYLLGALLGRHYFTDVVKKSGRKRQIASLGFLAVYIAAKNAFPESTYFAFPFVQIVIFAMSACAMWSVADMLMERIPHRPIFSRSFPIFVMHTNVSAIICKVIYLLLPRNGYFAFPNFLLTILLTLAVIHIFCIVLERLMPRTYGLLMGKGIK